MRYPVFAATLLVLMMLAPAAPGQDGRPGAEAPQSTGAPNQVQGGERPAAAQPAETETNAGGGGPQRRVDPKGDELLKLGFKDAPIDEAIFAFIAEATGKVVMPMDVITFQNKKITLLNDEFIPRREALDLLFQALRLNSIGVIEKSDVVIIGNIDNLMPLKQYPVVRAEEDIMGRADKGSLILKIFSVTEVPAQEIGDLISENLPSHAMLSVDPNSNQIVVAGDVALCQHLQEVITELDHRYIQAKTQTFRLAYADASEISDNILDLYESSGTSRRSQSGQGRQPSRGSQRGGRPGQPQQPRVPGSVVGPEIELRVTINVQQNSVTVVGEPAVVDHIATLIHEEWDLPRSSGTSKIYTLQYTDPLVVKEKLDGLLGKAGGASGGRRRTGGAAQGPAGVEEALSGIFNIEAYPDTSQLLVFSKTEESLSFLDDVIEQLDQPTSIGLPFVVELKHASAVELAEQLNALLAEAGAGATIRAPEEGLTGPGLGEVSQGATAGAGGSGSAGTLDFPWQRGGRQAEDVSPISPLIGKLRIVPIIRQNALAILCPRPQEEAVRELIDFFDRPGRQVMISVIIAEVELGDDLSLGIRLSSTDDLAASLPDNLIAGNVGMEGTKEDIFDNLFDTSILNANVNINVLIQALQQESNLRIIQQPVVFTADNQEAFFFDGQQIPFITDSSITDVGGQTQSFDYQDVGVILNVRPRITVQRDVDMELRLELSSVVPGVTLFGGAIIDKRQTATHVIVENGQTVVLSGILTEEESKITRKVPFFGDIPLIGELFTSRENSTTTSELIAFITPRVVDNPNERADFQEEYLDRLEDMNRPVLEQADDLKENPDKVRQRLMPKRPPAKELPPSPFIDINEINETEGE